MKRLLFISILFLNACIYTMEAPTNTSFNEKIKIYNPSSLIKLSARSLAKKAIEVYDSGEGLTPEQRYNIVIEYISLFIAKSCISKELLFHELYNEIITIFNRPDIFVDHFIDPYIRRDSKTDAIKIFSLLKGTNLLSFFPYAKFLDFFSKLSNDAKINLSIYLIKCLAEANEKSFAIDLLSGLLILIITEYHNLDFSNNLSLYDKIIACLNKYNASKNPESKKAIINLSFLIKQIFKAYIRRTNKDKEPSELIIEKGREIFNLINVTGDFWSNYRAEPTLDNKNIFENSFSVLLELVKNTNSSDLDSIVHYLIDNNINLYLPFDAIFKLFYPNCEDRFYHAVYVLKHIHENNQNLLKLMNHENLALLHHKVAKCVCLHKFIIQSIDLESFLFCRATNNKVVKKLNYYYTHFGIDFIHSLLQSLLNELEKDIQNSIELEDEDEEHIPFSNLKLAMIKFLEINYLQESDFKKEFEEIEKNLVIMKLKIKEMVEKKLKNQYLEEKFHDQSKMSDSSNKEKEKERE